MVKEFKPIAQFSYIKRINYFSGMPKKLATFLFIFLLQLFSVAQVYNFQHLNSKNGLPQSQAYAISFDNREFAWIGTQGGGIAVYDGESIEYITQENGLISNRIYDLKWINGAMYCASKGGLSIINSDKEVIESIRFDNSEELAQCLIFYNNEIWLGSNYGLYVLVNKKFELKNEFKNRQIFSLFTSAEKKLWVCTDQGVWEAEEPSNRINNESGLRNDDVTSVEIYNNGWLIGTYGNGLWNYKEGKLRRFPRSTELNSCIIHKVLEQDDKLWVATMNKGLFQLDLKTNNLIQYSTKQGLSNNHVRQLATDKWGNLWIGTSGGGVSIFNNSPFVTYNKSNGLYNNYIYAVLRDRKANLWVSTQGLGIQKIVGEGTDNI